MRVGLDGRMQTLKLTGIGRYSIQIYQWLSRLENRPELEVYPFGKSEIGGQDSGRQSVLSENRVFRGAFGLSRWAREKRIDLYHATNYGSAPLVSMTIPWVLTVHDLLPLKDSGFYGRYFAMRAAFLLRHNIPRASHIIAISSMAWQDTLETFKLDPGKITITQLGIDEELWWPWEVEKDKQIRAGYGLDWPYLLFVGVLNPRKNILGLIRAFHQVLRESKDENHRLVLAGSAGWKSREIFEHIQRNDLSGKVKILGFVPGADLPAIFHGATALVHPSFYESFAYPILEAYCAGIPVIASSAPNMPEVTGTCSLLINPHITEEIAEAMAKMISDPVLREKMIRQGRERSRLFNWKETALRTLAVYEKVLGGAN